MAERKSLLEVVLMPLVLTVVGTVGTYLITEQRQQAAEVQARLDRERADIAALASRQLKILEIFADKIVSEDPAEQTLAIYSTLALDHDLAAKLLPTFAIRDISRDAKLEDIGRKVSSAIVLARVIPDNPAGAISGKWLLHRSNEIGGKAVNDMTILGNPNGDITVIGRDWDGTGRMENGKGYYDWRFQDGRTGRTQLYLDRSGILFGWVEGANINWTFWGIKDI